MGLIAAAALSSFFALVVAEPKPAVAGKEPPPCVALAKQWVTKVESLPMKRRARAIELALRRDPQIVCGVIEQPYFATPPEAPLGCSRDRPYACKFPKGIEVAERLAMDSDPVLYLRVQTIATRLRERGLFTDAHERLLSTLLLGSQLAREDDKQHGR